MSEPLIKAIRKAKRDYAASPAGQLESLAREVSRWKRKLTIAQNKHDRALKELIAFAERQVSNERQS